MDGTALIVGAMAGIFLYNLQKIWKPWPVTYCRMPNNERRIGSDAPEAIDHRQCV